MINEMWDLIMHWCAILKIIFPFGAIPSSYANEDIIFSLNFTMPVRSDSLLALLHPILWRLLDEGIILVELFGGIGTRLATVMETGLTV